ncbi:hypothetical protein V1525DRAFT_377829 [Lipomyces kononenkoae]|uniref:Uncharacterized protein n=1 Tax=Lipomyces kononenkoae TaxID=34357 RepID=A0ACC3T153_LIPKO
MMDTVLPLVDISNPTAETGQKLYEAASTLGFVFIEGSEFSSDEVNKMFGLSAEFFSQPYDNKQNYAISEANRGYSCMNREVLDTTEKRGDPKEAFNFGQFKDDKAVQPLPQAFSTFEQDIADFSKKCHATCHKLLDLLAGALQIDSEQGGAKWFSSRHDMQQASGSILRFLYYPAVSNGGEENEIRAGAHTDYGSMTLLFQREGEEGLEVLSPITNEWIAIPALQAKDTKSCPPIVVNIADQLSFWSAGVLKSALHRVKFPQKQVSNGADRYSMAYFCHPSDNTLLEPVPSRVIQSLEGEGANAVAKNGQVLTAGEHLARRLAAAYSWKQ